MKPRFGLWRARHLALRGGVAEPESSMPRVRRRCSSWNFADSGRGTPTYLQDHATPFSLPLLEAPAREFGNPGTTNRVRDSKAYFAYIDLSPMRSKKRWMRSV